MTTVRPALTDHVTRDDVMAAQRYDLAHHRIGVPRTPVDGEQVRRLLAPLAAERDLLQTADLSNPVCPSCQHAADMHSGDGCWFTVAVGAVGRDLVCPCVMTQATLTGAHHG